MDLFISELCYKGTISKRNSWKMATFWSFSYNFRERSGSVVECLTRDRRVAGSSLNGVTALWSLSKTHLS